jgi:Zn-dependent protease with chaperone function
MSAADYFLDIWNKLLGGDATIIIGILIALLGLLFLVTEIRTKIKHGTTSENMMLAFIGLTFGLVLILMSAWLLAIALSFFVLAVYQTYQLRESPVWRELMITSVATYFVFLVGTVGDKIYFLVTNEETEIFTGWAYNLMIYVFLIMALIFFGRRFILVSRMMSPQLLYLVLFALIYVVLYTVTNILENTGTITAENLSVFYLSAVLNDNIAERIIFLTIAPYEIIILLAFGMYFVSGPLLTKLLGIKKIDDERILDIVEEIRVKLGIRKKIKVGYVKAPILNAMAYGPFFDQRVALIARDLSEFSDEDIKGIVAHELAHNSRLHVVWLQFIAAAEMVIKKAFLLPATTLDYAAYPQDVPFAVYFVINYVILAVLLILVRVLEGDADRVTKKIGYGNELAQALYKLEGFYQGIAGDFGLNVQLLTGKEFTEEENQRFLGEAGIRLYRHLHRPGRWDMFANIFMSHPRSAYRIIAMIDDEISPIKGALLPYWLLMPNFIRRKSLRKLNKKRDEFADLISEKYTSVYGKEGVKSFLEITKMDKLLSMLQDRTIVAYDHIDDVVVEGKVSGIHISDKISRPVSLIVQSTSEEKQIQVTDFVIHDAQLNEKYVLRSGKMGQLTSWKKYPKKNQPFFVFQSLEDKTQTFETKYTGKPIKFLEDLTDKEVFFYKEGTDRIARLTKTNFHNSFQASEFEFEVDEKGEFKEFKIKGEDMIVDLPPILLRFSKEKMVHQTKLLESLIGQSVILYTKEELEIGIACEISEITEDEIKYKIREKEFNVGRKKVDYIYVYADIPKIMMKNHVSFLDRLLYRISNWKDMKYIMG